MSAKRRRRPAPPAAKSSARPRRGSAARPDDAALERAVASVLRRSDWTIEELARQGIQRRGEDHSHVYRVKIRRGEIVRRSTVVALSADRPPPGALKPVLVRGHRIWVWRYPSDPFLPGLPRVTSNRRVRELLDEFSFTAGDPWLQRRVYRATRRAVVQADVVAGDDVLDTAYLKVLGDRKLDVIRLKTQRLADHHQQLGRGLPVPALLGVVPDEGILAIANVPGDTLRKAILDDEDIPTPADVAGLSIAMATLTVESDATPIRYADPTRHAKTIGDVIPSERARVNGLVAAAVVEGPLVTVHGDFHDGQVLVHRGRISGLIDIDGVGLGYLAHDAGRMIAYIESIGDIERAEQARVEGFVAGLRAAYADHVDDDNLERAVGAAWVALATGPHRRQQKDWQASTIRRLDHAERWLRPHL